MAAFKSVDHVGIVVKDLEVSIPWWNHFLEAEPFWKATWLAADIDDYVGHIVGYENCDMTCAFWSLPGGTVLEMLEYHNPRAGCCGHGVLQRRQHPPLPGDNRYLQGLRADARARRVPFARAGSLRLGEIQGKSGLLPQGSRRHLDSNLSSSSGQPRPFQEQSPFGDPYT